MDIGAALKYYRRLSGMTQAQVAEKAEVNEKYYGKIERGESSPTVERLEKICRSLGIRMQQLVGYSPVTQVPPKRPEGAAAEEWERERETERGGELRAYCNCCGTEFAASSGKIVCPQCGCEYDDENEFIERYGG